MFDSPLSELMNAMVTRLDYTQYECMSSVPEEKQWAMISLYISVDPVLASLYKQYCEAKENLGKLLVGKGADDPMTEIAWDMHDSLRSAIETRLLELKDDSAATERVAALQASQFASRMKKSIKRAPSPQQSLNEMMTFMLWAGMIMKNGGPARYDIRQDFGRAS